MKQFDHDNLDSEFKRLLDENHIQDLMPTWDEINQRLNKEMPLKKEKRFLYLWLVVAICVVTFPIYIKFRTGFKIPQQGIKSVLANPNEVHNVKSNPNNRQSGKSETIAIKHLNEKDIARQFSHVKAISPLPYLKSDSRKTKANNQQDVLHYYSGGNSSHLPLTFTNNNTTPIAKTDHQNTELLRKGIHFPTFRNSVVSEKTTHISSKENVIASLGDSILEHAFPLPESKNGEKALTKELIKTPPPKSDVKKMSWRMYGTLAPVFNLANEKPILHPGYYLGGGIEFCYNTHLSLRAGILFNHTAINTKGDNYYNYKPSKNLPSYNTLELKEVKGFLHFLEIPVVARYTINPAKKLNITLSTGISTVLFTEKNCLYDLLLDGNKQHFSHSRDDDNDEDDTNELSNNLKVGIGFGWKLKNKARIEIEPSIRVPIEEIGENLKTMGTFSININSTFPLKWK